jgi:hypothetical protein
MVEAVRGSPPEVFIDQVWLVSTGQKGAQGVEAVHGD